MRSRKPDIGPQMNSRIAIALSPSRSTDAGITAIAGVLRSGRLAAGSRRLSRITTSLTVTSTPLVKRGRNTDQARAASPAGRTNCPAEAGRIVHRIPQRGEVRQRHRALDPGLGEIERRDLILGGRVRAATAEARGHRRRRSPPAAAGTGPDGTSAVAAVRGRAVVPPSHPRRVVHNFIKPCWTASNTASPRV